jgi:hypothetical protein
MSPTGDAETEMVGVPLIPVPIQQAFVASTTDTNE